MIRRPVDRAGFCFDGRTSANRLPSRLRNCAQPNSEIPVSSSGCDVRGGCARQADAAMEVCFRLRDVNATRWLGVQTSRQPWVRFLAPSLRAGATPAIPVGDLLRRAAKRPAPTPLRVAHRDQGDGFVIVGDSQDRQVVMRHAMKNSMIPVITIVSLSFGSLLGGTIIMERVFSVPGIGSYLIESITVRDYTATQALVLLFGGSFILINLLVDIAYGWLDPRISHP